MDGWTFETHLIRSTQKSRTKNECKDAYMYWHAKVIQLELISHFTE